MMYRHGCQVQLVDEAARRSLTRPVCSSSAFLCSSAAVLKQQPHAAPALPCSHMKRSELPDTVCWLQEQGLLISRRDHGAHHKAPFNSYYRCAGWPANMGLSWQAAAGQRRTAGSDPRDDTPSLALPHTLLQHCLWLDQPPLGLPRILYGPGARGQGGV